MKKRHGTGWAIAVLVCALLLPAAAHAAYPAAKNGRIAFTAHSGTENNEVMLMGADGSGKVRLTNDTTYDEGPQFSPNGKLIVFSRDVDLSEMGDNLDIVTVRPNGSGMVDLTLALTLDGEGQPVFSPDGKKIAFFGDTQPGSSSIGDIFLMNANGTGLVNLTNTPTISEGGPEFSPDGRRIAYTGGPPSNQDVFVMNANGSNKLNLTSSWPADDDSPSFSPDGKKIAFTRDADPGMGPPDSRIFVMNANGTGAAGISGITGDNSPAYSPDGTRIAFRRIVAIGPENEYDLFVSNTNGSGAADLTAGLQVETSPTWEYIYKCAGKRATIVGDDGKDKIKGTKKADVIVANGGADTVSGRGGNDRICGGRGKDKLTGGDGKDKLLGGKGKDQQVQ